MSDFSNWKKVKTRKTHVCNGCLEVIPIRVTSTYGFGRFEGDLFNIYLCASCDEYLERNQDVMEEGFCDGDIGMARREETRTVIE